MNTVVRSNSAQEVTPMFLDVIKDTYQKQAIVPAWQMEEVRRRDKLMTDRSTCFLDCDAVINELDKALDE